MILLVADYEDKTGKFMEFLAKYTMPIFLMHTLFAAPLRSVLLKVGIANPAAHVVLGIGISFMGPIITAWIVKKTKWLEFFLYPNIIIDYLIGGKKMGEVTVLTPAYNREKLLQKLYKSLCNQDCKDFVWLIIDDGSSDNTGKYIDEIKVNADFSIKYYKKENGGKHTALNYAYQYIDTPLTFIVDSDDTLTSDAISTVKETYNKYKDEKDICGFSFLREKPGGGYLSTSGVPQDGLKESYVECRINRNIGGDMAEVWYTHCLKEYPFPEFRGEKFLGEDIVWVKMAQKYKMRFFNKVIYISDYLEDGLTNNRRKHNIKSPNGCVARAETFLNSSANLKTKIKSALQYQIYGKFANRSMKEQFRNTKQKALFALCVFPSTVLYVKWKREIL